MSYDFPPQCGDDSPWGRIDRVTPLGPDAVAVNTPSHGGICVSPSVLPCIPEPLRATAYSAGGWFEEDCDWCIPYLALELHRFESDADQGETHRTAARETLWRCHASLAHLLAVEGGVREPHVGMALSDASASRASAARLAELRLRIRRHGARSLAEEETLELLLWRCPAAARHRAKAASALLARFGCLPRVLGATIPELSLTVGAPLAAELAVLHDLTCRAFAFPMRKRSVLSSWSAVQAYLRVSLAGRSREAFHVLFLDKANQLIADERLGDGTVDHAPVYPREIMRRALELAASACVLAHNHPTGSASPSAADIEMTRRVVEAARPLGILIHDHLLVAGDQVVSFKGLGLM